ncbi:MAG: glycosyltransferase [Candidatus Poribacteria bacterium]
MNNKRITTTFFLILLVGIIAAHAFIRRLHFNQGITVLIEIAAIIVMGLILLIWARIVIAGIIMRKKFTLDLEYPVDIPNSPKISIIVPARNEEDNIRRCLESLQAVEYPNIEIIAVNDRSADKTGEIIAEIAQVDERVKFIQVKDLPDGWLGKIHAIHQGILHTTGDWYLFIDADVAIHKKAPEIALSYCLNNELKMLSIALKSSLETFWENIIMPVILGGISFLNPLDKVNDPDDEAAMASGAFIFVNASSYRAIGGFKNSIPTDVGLARSTKANGVPYRFMLGQKIGSTRWYESFREIWEAWSKYTFAGMNYQISEAIESILWLFILGILPFIVLIDQSVTLIFQGSYFSPIFWLALAQTLIILGYRFYSAVSQGLAKSYFFTHPLGSAIFIGIIINSVFRGLAEKSSWRNNGFSN